LTNLKEIAVDIETSGRNLFTDSIHGIAVCYEEDNCKYYTLADSDELRPLLANPKVRKIFHNANFDLKFLEHAGFDIQGQIIDTMLMARLVNEDQKLGLKILSKNYLGTDSIKFSKQINDWLAHNRLKKGDLTKAPPDLLASYACEDVNNTYKLRYVLADKIKILDKKVKEVLKVKLGPTEYYTEEAAPLEKVLRAMEVNGVTIDIELMNKTRDQLLIELKKAEDEFRELCKAEIEPLEEQLYQEEIAKKVTPAGKASTKRPVFNISSTKQMGQLFYKTYGFSTYFPNAKTETGQWQVSENIFSLALNIKQIPQKVKQACTSYLIYKKITKKIGTYIGEEGSKKGLLAKIQQDGKVHPSFKQASEDHDDEAAGTVTGRLSSAGPNLQNQPPFCRGFFIPSSKNDIFIYFDYSQIELRVAAHVSQDEAFVESYNNGLDLHLRTAQAIYKDNNLTKEDKNPRQAGKTTNFLLIFNGSGKRLMDSLALTPPKGAGLTLSIHQANTFRENFFKEYKGYHRYLMQQKDNMLKFRAVVSMFGLVRRLPELKYFEGLDYKKKIYKGSYKDELNAILNTLPPEKRFTTEYLNGVPTRVPTTIYHLAKRKYSHALNQGFNFPIQSAAASLMKRAMIQIHKEGYNIVNQVHDALIIQAPKHKAQNYAIRLQKILEENIKLSVPLVAEPKFLGSFSEEDIICF